MISCASVLCCEAMEERCFNAAISVFAFIAATQLALKSLENSLLNENLHATRRYQQVASMIATHCGNIGEEHALSQANGWTPFRLVEEVVCSWIFEAQRDASGTLVFIADASHDKVDWESGTNLRLECGTCFGAFPLPDQTKVEFE